jgi:hypothetical protein
VLSRVKAGLGVREVDLPNPSVQERSVVSMRAAGGWGWETCCIRDSPWSSHLQYQSDKHPGI